MRTRLTAEYGLVVPIVAAGMAFHSRAPLVAAVGNAGGMGVLGAALVPPDGLRQQIREVRRLSERPFGVDFITEFATDESEEASAHDEYKRRLLAASEADTVRTTMFGPEWPDQPTRVLRNRVVGEWAGREAEIAENADVAEPIGETVLGGQRVSMPRFSALPPTPETSGDFEEMCLLAGQGVALVHELRPVTEIVEAMAAEVEEILRRCAAGLDNAEAAPA